MADDKLIVCACGCGQSFAYDPRFPTKKYVDRTHLTKKRDPADKLKAQSVEMRALRAELRGLQQHAAGLEQLVERYAFVHSDDTRTPDWLKPERKAKGFEDITHHATAVLMLSDLHLDEVVDFHAMDGINAFDRAIAEKRFERIIDATVYLLRTYVAGVHFDGIVVPLLGDIITGEIHEELARTNAAPPPATITHWVPKLASGLKHLADELGRVFVPVVDGNHDRFYNKTPTKERAESSLAWVVYNWLADHLRDDDRIRFGITTSPEQLIDVYDTTFLLSHGDGFRSYGGVGGLYPAMLKWLLRKHDLYSQTKRDFDYALIGHWHQPLWGQDFVVNGSLKGYDEFAKHGGFKFALPSQQLFIVTPERGITQRAEVFAE